MVPLSERADRDSKRSGGPNLRRLNASGRAGGPQRRLREPEECDIPEAREPSVSRREEPTSLSDAGREFQPWGLL